MPYKFRQEFASNQKIANNWRSKNKRTNNMKLRIQSTLFALLATVCLAYAQQLSVEPVCLTTGAEGEIVVSVSDAKAMSAMQFCITLPDGFELKGNSNDNYGITPGVAVENRHTLSVQPLDEQNKTLLVVLYSMHFNPFGNGELLHIPVVATGEGGKSSSTLYNIRMADKDAKSYEYERVGYTAEVKFPELKAEPVSIEPGAKGNVAVNISNAAAMTALQFCLSLPSGATLDSEGIALAAAANNHILNVQPLASGDYLVVLYNLYKATFRDGTLLTISVVAGEDGGTITGSLYNVRMSTVDAVSYKCKEVSLDVTVNTPVTGIEDVLDEVSDDVKGIYDLQGRKVANPTKGIYIVDGKQVLVK